MSFTFSELDGKKMTVAEFIEKKPLFPKPVYMYLSLKNNTISIPVGLDSLQAIRNMVGRFEVYEDNDGTVDHYVIIRKELWFIVDLDGSENYESF